MVPEGAERSARDKNLISPLPLLQSQLKLRLSSLLQHSIQPTPILGILLLRKKVAMEKAEKNNLWKKKFEKKCAQKPCHV
jgi:hypothetical protein